MPQLKFIKEKDTTIYPITIPQGVITDVTNKKNLADSLDEKVDKENGTASNLTVTPASGGSTALTANGNVELGDNTSTGEGSKLVLKTGTNSACQITLESDADGKDPSINFSYGTDHPERGLSITGYTGTYPQGAISLNGGGTLKFPEFTGEDTFARKSEVDNKADSSAVPTKTSQLTNDSGFLTSHQDISGKLDKEKGTATNLTVNSSLIMPSGYFSVPNKAYIYCAGNEGGFGSIHFPDFSFLDIQNNYTLALTSDIPTTDTTLSTSSTNPIANKAVNSAIESLKSTISSMENTIYGITLGSTEAEMLAQYSAVKKLLDDISYSVTYYEYSEAQTATGIYAYDANNQKIALWQGSTTNQGGEVENAYIYFGYADTAPAPTFTLYTVDSSGNVSLGSDALGTDPKMTGAKLCGLKDKP